MNFQQIAVAVMVLACVLIINVEESKPVKLTKDVLIHPSVVLKRIFMSGGYTRPEIRESAVTTSVEKVSEGSVKMVSRGVPRETNGSFKSYMSYKALTDKSSPQWALQTECWTDGFGFRRWGEYYCVALGSRYSTNIGDKFKITFDTGVEIYVILSDCKSDRHTDKSNSYNPFNDNICEFLVDTNKLSKLALRMGDVSYGCDELKGGIVKIEEIIE